jgi:very-short-patch-repair endonuclease
MIYGIQGMSSEKPEVVELLKVMTILAKTCTAPLSAQAVGNIIYGLKSLTCSSDVVHSLLIVLASMVTSCTEPLSPQEVSNALFGLISLFDESNTSIMLIFRFLQSQYLRVIRVTEKRSRFDDAQMLTSNVCYFDYFLRKKGVSEQLSRELQDMKIGLERLELLGLRAGKASSKVSPTEQLYVKLFRKALQNNSRYIVLHQWYIDGIECDIIIIDSSTGTIVANIEIDGVHHSEPRKQHVTKLRDEYLTAHHGIRVVRVDAMVRTSNQDSPDAVVHRELNDLGIPSLDQRVASLPYTQELLLLPHHQLVRQQVQQICECRDMPGIHVLK